MRLYILFYFANKENFLFSTECLVISIDAMGLSSASQDAIEDDIFKQRLDSTGKKMDGSQPEKQSIIGNL
jgi:hypothetical protein